jgi:hypothetical protein
MKQAEQSGVWSQSIDDRTFIETPSPVNIDVPELTQFCRDHMAYEGKLRQMCDDRLEIEYRDLIIDYGRVMAEVFSYLNLPDFPRVRPGIRRLKNCGLRDRVFNFQAARERCPRDVQEFFDAADLF